MNSSINIYAAIAIFVIFGSLFFSIGCAIGRGAERKKQQEYKEWGEVYPEEEE